MLSVTSKEKATEFKYEKRNRMKLDRSESENLIEELPHP